MPVGEGGEARNHEVEVEAVARAFGYRPMPPHLRGAPGKQWETGLRMARAALDALRRPEARNHEVEVEVVSGFADHGTLITKRMRRAWAERVIAALDALRRSPQGEGHEGIYQRLVAAGFSPKTADEMMASYLSRCPSPEREASEECRRALLELHRALTEGDGSDADHARLLDAVAEAQRLAPYTPMQPTKEGF
jgi:hypothetical protein